MAHSHHAHREHQVSHRRVHHILKGEPEGAKHHSKSHAFSKVTSKSAAHHHDEFVAGAKSMKRYARGGKVKAKGGPVKPSPQQEQDARDAIEKELNRPELQDIDDNPAKKRGGAAYAKGGRVKSKSGHQTNIAIVVPHRGAQQPMAGAPPGGAMPMPAPGGPPPGMPPGAGGPPPGMPMHKRGGKVIDGESTEADLKKWGKYAHKNSGYFRGGAASGVGREEKAEHEKRKGK